MARKAIFRLLLWLAFLFPVLASPAFAAVEIAFYSRELGSNFPHAFVVLRGTVDATGERVDTNYGFTAHAVAPAVLFGSVRGEVIVEDQAYISRSDRQFALTLTDAQYRAVMAVVERWRALPQPSFNRRRSNCTLFVSEIAAALGLQVDNSPRLVSRPRSFLLRVRELNPQLTSRETAAGEPAPAP